MSTKKTTSKRSMKAQQVARDISEALVKGKKISESTVKQIILNNGYSESVANKPSEVLNTKSYKEAHALYVQPAIDAMHRVREKTLNALENKDYSSEPVASLAQLLKVINHDTRLLQGESTSNVAMKVDLTSLFDNSPKNEPTEI